MNDLWHFEHGYAWHFFAKKGEAARWHFMGSIYHLEVIWACGEGALK